MKIKQYVMISPLFFGNNCAIMTLREKICYAVEKFSA